MAILETDETEPKPIFDPTIPNVSPELGSIGVIWDKAERTEPLDEYTADDLRFALAVGEGIIASDAAKAHVMYWFERKSDGR